MKRTVLPLCVFLIVFISCESLDNRETVNCIPATNDQFEPGNLIITDFRDNVLRKEIRFTTEDSTQCYVVYWNDDEQQILTKKTDFGTQHDLILLFLTANSSYSFMIIKEDRSGRQWKTKILDFTTTKIPVNFQPYAFSSHVQHYQDDFNGIILTHQRALENKLLILLNGRGDIIWYEKLSKSPNVFDWTPEGTIISLLSSTRSLLLESDEILEIDLYGDTISHIMKGEDTFNKGLHHDIMVNRAGNIYAITYETKIVDFSPLGIDATDTVFCDGIVELDRAGNKLWEWSAFDVAEPLEDPVAYRRRSDWLHANDIIETDDHNLLISFRHNNQLWKIDRNTGQILWKLGEGGDFAMEDRALFVGQHHVHFSNTGDLMIFDNNNETSQSRILYLKIDELIKSASLTREIKLPLHYYTYIMGSAFETPDNNLLINTTSGGSIALVDMGGSVIWEITTNTYPYRAIFVENLIQDYAYCR